MNEKQIDRLVDALLSFVERVSKAAASETEIEALPKVAAVLLEIVTLR